MFYSHQLLARKAPLGQIWMAATWGAKIKQKQLDRIDILEIWSGEICWPFLIRFDPRVRRDLNPPVPMALRLSVILMGGVAIVHDRKTKSLLF